MIPELTQAQIYDGLRSADAALFDAALSAVALLPPISDVPTPGQAGPWSEKDWEEWGKANGFTQPERTKHNFAYLHEFLPIRVSVSSSPGDCRAMMNLAQDVRLMIRENRTRVAAVIRHLFERDPTTSLSAIETRLRSPNGIQEIEDVILDSAPQMTSDTDMSRLRSVLKKLEEYGYPARRALLRVGTSEHNTECILLAMKNGDAVTQTWFTNTYPGLADLLELERAAEEAEKEAKRRARERPVEPAAPVDPEQTKFEATIASTRANLQGNLKTIQEKATQLNNMLNGLGTIINSSSFPKYPGELIRGQAAIIADTTQKLEAAVADAEAKGKRVDELQDIINQMQTEKAVAEQLMTEAAGGGEWRMATERLIVKLQQVLSAEDFIGVAHGLAAARIILTDARKAVGAGVAPTVVS